MRRRIKSYLIFTTPVYRWVIYLGLPLLLVGMEWFTGVTIVLGMLIFVEIASDNWFLGGIQERNAEKLDYLKTSYRGMQVIRSALVLDLVRRFAETAAVFGTCCLLESIRGAENLFFLAGELFPLTLTVYGMSVLGILFTRFFSYMAYNFVGGYLASMAGIVCYVLKLAGILPVGGYYAAFLVIGAAVSILIVRVASKKVEGGYYDR